MVYVMVKMVIVYVTIPTHMGFGKVQNVQNVNVDFMGHIVNPTVIQ